MNYTSKFLNLAGGVALVTLGATSAHAAGTTAGSTITNSVSVNYQVGGIAQTATSASDTFTVDRKINLLVAEVGSATTSVTPGQTSAVTTFTVTNQSNEVLDFRLAVAQLSGGSAPHGGTDSFNVSNIRIYRETGATAGFSGDDQLITYLDELAADASATVYVVVDVPLGQANGTIAGVTLTATGREGGTSSSEGSALVETTGANTSGKDTVFADAAGATDGLRDAAHSAQDDYTVSAAAISATKTSKLISDPVNGTTNPKAIPGAVIEYCIAVANGSGAATATNVAISDTLPTTVTYNSGYGIFLNGTVTSGVCNADGSAGGSFSAGTVSGTISSIAATETKTVRFRATIN